MTRCDETKFWAFDGRQLTAEEWQQFKGCAQEAYTQARRDLFVGLHSLIRGTVAGAWHAVRACGRWTVATASKWWQAHVAARQRKRAIRELGALDDRMLKDIGLGRSEIESVIFDAERLEARRRPLVTRGRECVGQTPSSVRRQAAPKPANGALIDRTAA